MDFVANKITPKKPICMFDKVKNQDHLLGKTTKPAAKIMLTDDSLIKWDNKNNEKIINK
jgi:hypothetical protein